MPTQNQHGPISRPSHLLLEAGHDVAIGKQLAGLRVLKYAAANTCTAYGKHPGERIYAISATETTGNPGDSAHWHARRRGAGSPVCWRPPPSVTQAPGTDADFDDRHTVIDADVGDLNGDGIPDLVALDGVSAAGLAYPAAVSAQQTAPSRAATFPWVAVDGFCIGRFRRSTAHLISRRLPASSRQSEWNFKTAIVGFNNPTGRGNYIAEQLESRRQSSI